MHIVYTAIFPRKMSAHVWTCQSTLRFVEACKSYFFPFIIIIPLYMKIIQKTFQQIPTKLDTTSIAYFIWNVKNFSSQVSTNYLLDKFFTSIIFDSIFRHHDSTKYYTIFRHNFSTWCDKIFRHKISTLNFDSIFRQ